MENAKCFDMKFGTVIVRNVAKKWQKNIFKIAAIRIMTSPVTSIFLKNYRKKRLKCVSFPRINLVTVRKNIFKIFFQLLKFKTT